MTMHDEARISGLRQEKKYNGKSFKVEFLLTKTREREYIPTPVKINLTI